MRRASIRFRGSACAKSECDVQRLRLAKSIVPVATSHTSLIGRCRPTRRPMLQEERWTIGKLLSWTAEYLERQGSDSPRLDAEVLLAHARGSGRIELYTEFEETADEALRDLFRDYVRQRANGTPVAYLVGHREFYSLDFQVTRDVLIPRPETEHIVVLLKDWAESWPPQTPLEVADVGTGSGVLAVCAAKLIPDARVVAIDISAAALDVARHNADRHAVTERIEFVESDLLAAVDDRSFAVIVSNPPYVSTSEMRDLPTEAKDHEPELALHAGPTGLEVVERLVGEAATKLVDRGLLLIEISPMIAEDAERLVDQQPTLQRLPTTRDLAGHPRVLRAVRQQES